jgi:tRNA G18 (ribose-2'-O)-methylase SpoU
VSVGAALSVPFARLPRGEDIPGLLARHGFMPFALSPQGRSALQDVVPPPRSALLFGAEGAGLPESVMAGAHTVRIPMAAGFDSLNVATASGIVLHRFATAQ